MIEIRVKVNAINGGSVAQFLAAHRVEIEEAMRSAIAARAQEMADEAADEILYGIGEGEPKGLLSASMIEPQ